MSAVASALNMSPLSVPVLDWWGLLLVIIAVLLGVYEVAFRFGRRADAETRKQGKDLGALTGAILALLGLLLAFSFSIAENRFAKRKSLLLEEANAIGTTYLRAGTLPEESGERIRELLRQYVDARTGLSSAEDVKRALAVSGELHDELWAEAAAVARAQPDSEIAGLFLVTLNETIDLHQSRVTVALYQRLPAPILYTLWFVSILATALLGYGAGVVRWRGLVPTLILILSISSVIVLIVELDRPIGSIFRVDQSALEAVREQIDQHTPAKKDLAASPLGPVGGP